jgi:hypothetical protein
MKKLIIKIIEKGLPIFCYIFPLTEISTTFAGRVFLNADNALITNFYINYVGSLTRFYINNIYLVFGVMIGIFITCSNGSLPLKKFSRFNTIQAILLSILCSLINAMYPLLPLILRESYFGLLLSHLIYFSVIFAALYASLFICYEKYPSIPLLSEAARLHVQRGYLED